MTRLTDMAFTSMLMAPNMKENGRTTNNTDLGLKSGLTEADTKDST